MQLYRCRSVCFVAAITALVVLLTFYILSTPRQRSREAIIRGESASPPYNSTDGWKALHFSKAAYCDVETVENWSCGNSCSTATPNFHVYNVYSNTSTGNLGYSGLDHDGKRIVVAFRGTYNTANWIQNLDFWLTPYPHPGCGKLCKVHGGFYEAYGSLRAQMIQDLLVMHSEYPFYTLFITGHSLGGAIASLAAVEVTTWDTLEPEVLGRGAASTSLHLVPMELYTFGEPRVGNVYFANWSSSVLGSRRAFRLTHGKDPVPHLPPCTWGYVHIPQEVWYPASGEEYYLCNDTAVSEDPRCSNSVYATNVTDHLMYLGVCTRCECTAAEMEEINCYKLSPEMYSILALDYALTGLIF
ncbi:lipase, putative [Leishmania tarentolae]|uniref:Lipase, putative n=1 Tax=Leishmania tarentolae TaxID=5689 RepID=A0A640KNS3_LEITA|nr:lipase, putative [Leishmania tarentolae]